MDTFATSTAPRWRRRSASQHRRLPRNRKAGSRSRGHSHSCNSQSINPMSSLRRSPNSPFWIACLTLPCGMRTNRSTKTADRRLAQRLADEWQTAACKARDGRFVENQARKVLNDILAKVGEEQLNTDTVESFLRRWLAGKGAGGTAMRYSSTVELFLEHLGGKKDAMPTAISHQDILGFIDRRIAVG